jgi:hypothetical protein
MGYDRRQLKEATKPLYGFREKRTKPVGSITLLVSFGNPRNARTQFITYDVVDIHYWYNTIFDRGLLNTFKAVFYSV